MTLLEFVLLGSVVYAVGTGKVKDINSAARTLGQFVGRASGGARRLRANASEMMSKATLQPGVADSTAALRETMAQYRAIQSETAATVSIAGNRAFIQDHFRRQFANPLSGASNGTTVVGPSLSDAAFTESEVREALGGSIPGATTLLPHHPTGTSPNTGAAVYAPGLTGLSPPPLLDIQSSGFRAKSMAENAGSEHSNSSPAAADTVGTSAVGLLCSILDAERCYSANDERGLL